MKRLSGPPPVSLNGLQMEANEIPTALLGTIHVGDGKHDNFQSHVHNET